VKKKRYLFKQKENYNFITQAFFETRTLRSYGIIKNLKTLSGGSLISIKNHCHLTNRFGSIFSDYKLSRLKFRTLALYGRLNGVQKACW